MGMGHSPGQCLPPLSLPVQSTRLTAQAQLFPPTFRFVISPSPPAFKILAGQYPEIYHTFRVLSSDNMRNSLLNYRDV